MGRRMKEEGTPERPAGPKGCEEAVPHGYAPPETPSYPAGVQFLTDQGITPGRRDLDAPQPGLPHPDLRTYKKPTGSFQFLSPIH
jgi:hypothetical protein